MNQAQLLRRRLDMLPGDYARVAKHGTTTVGILVRDGVVLAADKRATAGYYVAHKHVKKIIPVDDRIVITTAGLVADAQMLVNWIRTEIMYYKLSQKKPMKVRSVTTLLANVLFSNSRFYPYIVQLLVGGYDDAPRLFNLDWFGSMTEEKYIATGSGSPIALGVIEDGYSEDLNIEEAEKLAVRAVASALKRDTATGNGIDVAVVTREGIREKTYLWEEILKSTA